MNGHTQRKALARRLTIWAAQNPETEPADLVLEAADLLTRWDDWDLNLEAVNIALCKQALAHHKQADEQAERIILLEQACENYRAASASCADSQTQTS